MLGLIFEKAQNKIQDPAKLKRLISDLIDRERFNLVIGVVFLAIVLFSPDGLLGWWASLKSKFPTPRGGSK